MQLGAAQLLDTVFPVLQGPRSLSPLPPIHPPCHVFSLVCLDSSVFLACFFFFFVCHPLQCFSRIDVVVFSVLSLCSSSQSCALCSLLILNALSDFLFGSCSIQKLGDRAEAAAAEREVVGRGGGRRRVKC